MKSFFKEAVGTIRTSGTINPSSKHLIKNCLKDIVFSDSKTILEFGPGDGCVTREILKRMNADSKLYSFELNPTFYSYCKKQFSPNKNIHVLNMSALEFDNVLSKKSIREVDCIISSLPLALVGKFETEFLLKKVNTYLKAGGIFVQYQYSLNNYRQLKDSFDSVKIDLTIRNLPPAFVYTCNNRLSI